jgi:hypothetical protein
MSNLIVGIICTLVAINRMRLGDYEMAAYASVISLGNLLIGFIWMKERLKKR